MDFETFFYDFLAIINILFFALVKKTHDISLIIIEKVKNYDYQALGLKIIFYAGQAKQFLVETYENNCKKGDPIDVAKETVVYYIKYLHSVVLSYHIEPMENEWISTACIYQTDFDKTTMNYSYNEIYQPMAGEVEPESTQPSPVILLDQFKQWFHASQNIMKTDKKIEESLLTMKTGDTYIYKLCTRENKCCLELPNELSKIKFLNIEYCHPENEKSITIDIDKNGYLVGNEILSSTFVKRCLEYMNGLKSFDMNYTLKIMDNNLDSIVLKSDEYIVLEQNSYKIMKRTAIELTNDWVDVASENNETEFIEKVMDDVNIHLGTEPKQETIVEPEADNEAEPVPEPETENGPENETEEELENETEIEPEEEPQEKIENDIE
uniref:Uncharacterized protein n=1 Tax=viral metagenome TaxID=1070528 RepID=A0A6C0HC27_9ZZZZ